MIFAIRTFLVTMLLVMASMISDAQTLAGFEVDLAKATNGIDVPASIKLSELKISPSASFTLAEIKENKQVQVPYQINKTDNTISWMIPQTGEDRKKHFYQLIKSPPGKFNEITAENKDGALTIIADNKTLLR